MDLLHYKFSKEAQPQLELFLAAVQKLYPERIPQKIQDTDEVDEVEIIEIQDSEEIVEKSNPPYELSINLSLAEPAETTLDPAIQDFVKYIQESVETAEDILESNDIKKLLDFNDYNLAYLFEILVKTLSDQALFSLTNSIVSCAEIDTNHIARLFCSNALLPKIKESDPTLPLKSALKEFLDKYPQISRTELLIPLFIGDSNFCKWQESIVNVLSDRDKQYFLKDFIYACTELESWQFSTIQSLLVLQTEDCVKRRLINLLDISSDKFNTEKLFLKLMISVIQCLGKGFEDQERLLYNIVEKNKTLLKISARRALEDWSNTYNI